jgi:hypothetical protein
MLNLKADYALGNGKWRVMGGYEIQNLSYKTFEGVEAGINNYRRRQPRKWVFFYKDFDQGEISGLNGGSRLFRLHLFMILEISNQIQQAVIILKLQMNIPVSILVRLNLTNCFYKERVLEVAFR